MFLQGYMCCKRNRNCFNGYRGTPQPSSEMVYASFRIQISMATVTSVMTPIIMHGHSSVRYPTAVMPCISTALRYLCQKPSSISRTVIHSSSQTMWLESKDRMDEYTATLRGHVKAKGRVSDLYLERIDKELKTLQVWKEDDEHARYVESSMESYSSAQHDCGAQLDRRIASFLKAGKYAKRVDAGAPVYLSIVLEYLAPEHGAKASMDPRQTRSIMTPAEDEELVAAFETCIITSVPMVLTSAIELGIIDLLAREEAPRTIDRMLRLLASFSYLSCTLDGDQRLYSIGPKGKYFVSSEAGSFAPLLRFLQHKTVINGWYGLQEAVKNGGSPFQNANQMSIFDCAVKDPAFSALLNNGMKGPTPLFMNKILESYRGFEGAKMVVDVGGGIGESLQLILNKFPNLRGTNYDLPHVVKDAPTHPRMEHVGGDLSKSIPKADILFIKVIFKFFPPS
ncbi:hypothetical protein NL676_030675 [Syzygium grande]|nr:hypothetical protein NL676_030675 [Syzygium grande]